MPTLKKRSNSNERMMKKFYGPSGYVPLKRSKAALIRRKQKQVDVKVARQGFRQMIQDVATSLPLGYLGMAALAELEHRVREWRP